MIQKLLFQLEPETAHNLVGSVFRLVPKALLSSLTKVHHRCLESQFFGQKFSNPIGLAAGFDKNAQMVPFLQACGFGFLELGSITAHPCSGRERPRIFRLTQDRSLINRMGLPNQGAQVVSERLQTLKSSAPLGINIAKTPDFAFHDKTACDGIEDFLTSYKVLAKHGSYTVLNLSCPNTGEAKTFDHPELFEPLITAVTPHKHPNTALLIKLSPDLEYQPLKKTVELACQHGVDGFVVSNTTATRAGLKTPQNQVDQIGNGGLSGQALTSLAHKQLKAVYDIVGKTKLIIGVGGVMGFQDMLDKFACGAQLVQIYTGWVYGGPFFVKRLNQELIAYCHNHGFSHYSELVGNTSLPAAA